MENQRPTIGKALGHKDEPLEEAMGVTKINFVVSDTGTIVRIKGSVRDSQGKIDPDDFGEGIYDVISKALPKMKKKAGNAKILEISLKLK